ncbi:low-density lipoprotein receptor-related protein 2-like isoform X2 [Siniperca chuatsi]|uniref:low-density lipoprotein receptor-related protein 2-like isoform X2 n=1 Tax=Siniperca chuatsi TaxID=119488 RepID=UPI001CE180E4|nr:low-density lipoprotein receptor-related protein 2-like isoform X2 [Siniperca chuatsi]
MDLRQIICLIFLASLSPTRGQIFGCHQGQWQCDDGNCIPDVWRCDEDGDCLDGSDEMDCTGSPECLPGQFPCVDSVGCVNVSARCDGQNQCPTGSDEENCTAEGCLDSDWTCRNHICIPKELHCNGLNDCLDNSDEEGCGLCGEDGIRCPEGTCLSAEERCDGQVHCSDGSDEPITCGRICSMNNGGCSHLCVDEAWGALCACPVGYKLSPNGAVCEDLDECAPPFAPCMHHCTNTIGSFYCHCREGFKLNGSSTCLATGNATRLLTVQRKSIGLLNVKSQQFEVIQTPVFDVVALTFDVDRGWYYWADNYGSIYKSDGQHSWTVYTGEPGIKGLACDWLNGNVFWTNQKTESIYMQAADGKSYTTLLSKNISPSELVLIPLESLMFWISAGHGDRKTIEKSWMDGSERSSLTVLTAQSAHSLTADVAARRLYWISDFKKSIETVKVDGTGRCSFTGLFNRRPALSLAVFESLFYWVDDKGLWQVPQNQPNQKKFIWKAALPILAVYHKLQQPQGSSACVKTPCHLCQLTKGNPVGFTCACPNSKVLLPDGTCEYPRFIYATITNINLLEFRGRESTKIQLFTTDDGILSFDVDWYRDWLYWANQTGHIQRTSLTQFKSQVVPSSLPVCLIKVDQRKGNLYWVSCDQNSIGTTTVDNRYSQQLYHTTREIQDLYLDWLRGGILWLEEERIFTMSMMGGKAKELLHLAAGVRGNIAFDLRANSLLWNSKWAGLTTMSLLQERSHQAGRRWNISGSIIAAFEPFLLSLSDDVMTLWDRRDGSRIQDMIVGGHVLSVIAALREVSTVPNTPVCKEPFVLCRHTSICLSQAQLCDGKKDCPNGDDEDFCVTTCPSKEDFKCKDSRSCISRNLVCDGRSNCRDGSDEVDCPTIASPAARANILKCRTGSKPCKDGTECVLYSHVCDGEKDCRDGSDEEGCDAAEIDPTTAIENVRLNESPLPVKPFTELPTKPFCTSPSVLCPDSSLCINPSQLCDGKRDCPDGSDENCVKRCPYKTDFLCKDRRSCVSKSLVCDGRSHCHDGSDEVACPGVATPATQANVLKCRMGSRLCRDGTECVLFSHVCDGERDCQDGSDEEGCDAAEIDPTTATENVRLNESPLPVKPFTELPTKPFCTSPSVLCPDSSLCINPSQLCDGKRDCPDGSDENCVKRCPYKTDFLCKDRRSCVSKSLVCDGRSHCHDGSDEVACPGVATPATQANILKCRMGSRLCRDGTECVLFSHVCDGETDCQDGSDEEGCDAAEIDPTTATENVRLNESPLPVKPFTELPTKPFCTSPSVLCRDSSLCINPSQLCDGKRDCPDGSDENCVKRCPYKTDFLCKDRRSCVSKSLVCDGRSHCHDGSDEVACPGVATPATQANVLKCRMGSKPCKDDTECVLYSHVCDGENDCMDGSDEQGCPETCKQDEFQCSHRKMCIPEAQVCDGKSQCRDQSDELDCKEQTKSCEYHCADGKRCIPKKFLCDGERDCVDGTDEVGCDPVTAATTESPVFTSASTCITPSVRCPRSSQCISQKQLCDGQRDCPDGYDEKNCMFQCKNPDDFLCSDRRACVPRMEVCDGRAHCPDGSDEKQCLSADPTASPSVNVLSARSAPLRCRKGFKPCKDGVECVMYSHVCDGEKDCQDGSDEEGCAAQCKADEFQCAHGNRCIPPEQVCDGQHDCQDRSDEMDCSSLSEGCHQRCDNYTRCIPETFLCDGERDCADGSDEEKCGLVACAINQYRCASGQCVSEALRCDGYADCSDRSDEVDCTRPPRCPTQLRCPNSHECLQKQWLCDGEDDCKDGSDEKNCMSPPAKCREYQWQCGDTGQCIPLSWRCDGKEDCHNGVDEDKCSQRKCPSHLYRCGSGECVDHRLVCNRFTNCADSSDEGVGCAQHNCSSPSAPQCDHDCVSTPNGPRCYCAAGFELNSSAVSCVDTNECNAMPHAVCKHTCLNTRGSYICLCHPGFYLEPDNKSCKSKDEPLLLASVQSELLLLGVHSSILRLLSSASRPVFSLDYHWAQQRVYWLSPDYQSIRWADMKNSNKGTLIKGVKSDFIAVDWVGKNLYWVDGLVGQILAVKLSNATVRSQDYTVVLGEDLEQPSSLVLLPHRGLMLWSEIGSTPQIEQSGMDGSKRKVVVSRGLSWPVSLAYDLLDNRVYWADEKLRCIGSASLDGDNVKILQLAETPSPFSVAVFNDRVFWSDTKRRTIRSGDKNTGKDQKVLLKRPGQPFGLRLMHSLSQPAISSPCDQLHCSHLCLLAPAGRSGAPGSPAEGGPTAVCRCPKGMLLSKDKITCSLPMESTFILLLSHTTVYQIYLHSMRRDGVALKKMPNSRVLALPGVTEASGLDVSIQELSLYVADAGQGSVDVLKLSSSRSRQGLTPSGQILKLREDSITALAVDWVTSNLYWSSTERPNLHVTSSHDGYTTSLLQRSLKGTTSIALHPPSGRLCYTAMVEAGGRSQVDCAWMDGRNKAVLWRKSSIPSSLAFSNQGTMIYWADTGQGVINSVGVDGTGYKQYKTGPGLLISLTHTENILLWVTLDKDVTKLWFSDSLQPNQLWFETKTSVVEVKAYSRESQSGTNSCSNNNGGCVHLCLSYPGGRTCKCGQGFYSVNSTSCAPLPDCPTGEESCFDGNKCISSSKFCDGHVDCPDQSDEQDCPNTNSASFRTKASDGRPPQSSSSPHPNAQKNSVLSVEDSTSCDLQHCNSHGNCITEGKTTRCQCMTGYKGEFCQETETGHSHVAVVLGVFCLIAVLMAAAFIFAKRRAWASIRSRSVEKETLMANMGLSCEHYDSDSEELESPVDVKNPPLALKSLQLK